MAGCPDVLPGSGKDQMTAVAEKADIGVSRVVLPLTAFEADLENNLSEFGEKVIKKFDAN
jgi:2-methylisocitrate lyase-like PEP mutase family enzyme